MFDYLQRCYSTSEPFGLSSHFRPTASKEPSGAVYIIAVKEEHASVSLLVLSPFHVAASSEIGDVSSSDLPTVLNPSSSFL